MLATAEFAGYGHVYSTDLADNIRDDYKNLASNALQTALLVFIAMWIFVGWRDAFFSIVALPLAFLATFIMLNSLGYTMNFLTNFSLIISFGIAIDTVIVIVEAASVNQKLGYNPRTAITLALREYAVPVISGVLTTIVVFVPMMVLPGVLGKFMAYIPITIFWVLALGLILVLTVNNALYILFNKRKNYYTENTHALEYMSTDERDLLMIEREGKEHRTADEHWLRARFFNSIEDGYRRIATPMIESTFWRRVFIFGPVLLLILSVKFLAPLVGFNLFPGDDNAYTSFNITWPVGQITEKTLEDLSGIDSIFVGYGEIEHTSITISDNRANIAVQLTKKDIRKENEERSVFDIEKILLEKLKIYEQKWYKVASEVLQNWPPGGKAMGIKLVADSPEKLDTLIVVSKEFENYLKGFTGSKNVWRSSSDTPW
jgi:multidrug efflux pump subunit AcrB